MTEGQHGSLHVIFPDSTYLHALAVLSTCDILTAHLVQIIGHVILYTVV